MPEISRLCKLTEPIMGHVSGFGGIIGVPTWDMDTNGAKESTVSTVYGRIDKNQGVQAFVLKNKVYPGEALSLSPYFGAQALDSGTRKYVTWENKEHGVAHYHIHKSPTVKNWEGLHLFLQQLEVQMGLGFVQNLMPRLLRALHDFAPRLNISTDGINLIVNNDYAFVAKRTEEGDKYALMPEAISKVSGAWGTDIQTSSATLNLRAQIGFTTDTAMASSMGNVLISSDIDYIYDRNRLKGIIGAKTLFTFPARDTLDSLLHTGLEVAQGFTTDPFQCDTEILVIQALR